MRRISILATCILCVSFVSAAWAQQPTAAAGSVAVVPPLVSFSGVLTDINNKPLTGAVGVTFALYKNEQRGAPLWLETQNVYPDKTGHYTVLLGATTSTGLPADLFVAGEARWLGIQPQGQAEQPRISLTSAPYALKAADAQTVGGLPASAFVLAAPGGTASAAAFPSSGTAAVTPNLAGSGTQNYVPLWTDSAGTLGNSVLYQSGTGSTAKMGINTTTPSTTLDIKGGSTVRGTLTLPSTGTATASAGKNSQPQVFVGSVFNSGTGTAVNQKFQWQVEPVGNNTATTSGTLSLRYASGTNTPAETGLKIANTGQITFASGQTFPGTGTVSSVGSGAGLTGGPITGSGTLSIATGGVTNAMLANPSLTITPGTALTGGGVVALGGATTLNLDTTKVPLLAAANTFTGNQTVNGNLSATQAVSANAYQIGSNLFAFGTYANANAFLGFSGNATMTGTFNTATGYAALASNTTGGNNTATGYTALAHNTTGYSNTATGYQALDLNTTGSGNTASGFEALYNNTTASENTASGYQALANNTGSYNTASGFEALSSNTTGISNTASGVNALYSNTTGGFNTAVGVGALYSNTAGAGNTAAGFGALKSNTTASYNTADGYQALNYNITGTSNTATGYQALYNNTTYSNNTADGYLAMFSNNTGGANTATGSNALYSNTAGNNNAAFGVSALYHNTTGSQNTGCGYTAMAGVTTGSLDTGLGYQAAVGSGTLTNASAIGAMAQVNESNAMVLGSINGVNGSTASVNVGIGTTTPSYLLHIGSGGNGLRIEGPTASGSGQPAVSIGGLGDFGIDTPGCIECRFVVKESGFVGILQASPTTVFQIGQGWGNGLADGWSTYSSRRWKTNIETLHGALGKVEQLRGVSYDRKDSGKHEIGVIAEEVGAVVPEVVSYEKNGKDASGVDYARLTALLIEATKEQQKLIDKQQQQIGQQKTQIAQLRSRVNTEQRQIESQQAQIARLGSQVKAIQAALKTNKQDNSKVRTVKAQVPTVQQ